MTITQPPRPDVRPAWPWRFPQAETLTLDNGLTVLAYDLPGKKVAALRMVLDLGTAAEPVGSEGIGHLAFGALATGTKQYDAQDFATARSRLGATFGTSCDTNAATVTLDVPVSRIGPALDLLAEAVLRPTFPTAEVARLQQQRLGTILAEQAHPIMRSMLELSAAYYSGRRSLPPGGTAQSVATLTRDAVASFYLDGIDPATSTLVIAGDFAGVDLAPMLQQSFGAWRTTGATRSERAAGDAVGGPRVVLVDRPGSVQTQLVMALPAVDLMHPDLPALQIAAHALGGGLEGRLMQVLREEKGYTYGIGAQVQAETTDGRMVFLSAIQTEFTAPALDCLFSILRDFANGGIRDDECATAVDALAGRAPLKYESAQSVAAEAVAIVAGGLPADNVDRLLTGLRAGTPEEVSKAFTAHAVVDRAVLVCVGDGATIRDSLTALALADVTEVPA